MGAVRKGVSAVKTALSQVVRPLEQVAAGAVSTVAATFGVPITPDQVKKLAAGIKASTYAKPASQVIPTAGGNVFSGALATMGKSFSDALLGKSAAAATATEVAKKATGRNWLLIGGGVLLIGGVAYYMTRGK